ncbi:MAG: hypothetical protein LBS49_10995 [Candidatus Accumulibacter sp.]|nr:hypothetical protein [Accumulibacter sp.]
MLLDERQHSFQPPRVYARQLVQRGRRGKMPLQNPQKPQGFFIDHEKDAGLVFIESGEHPGDVFAYLAIRRVGAARPKPLRGAAMDGLTGEDVAVRTQQPHVHRHAKQQGGGFQMQGIQFVPVQHQDVLGFHSDEPAFLADADRSPQHEHDAKMLVPRLFPVGLRAEHGKHDILTRFIVGETQHGTPCCLCRFMLSLLVKNGLRLESSVSAPSKILTCQVIVYTVTSMEIEFDPAKDAANRKKHGLSLVMPAEMEWDDAHVWPDTRFFTMNRASAPSFRWAKQFFTPPLSNAATIRIISLRKASKAERTLYVEHAR